MFAWRNWNLFRGPVASWLSSPGKQPLCRYLDQNDNSDLALWIGQYQGQTITCSFFLLYSFSVSSPAALSQVVKKEPGSFTLCRCLLCCTWPVISMVNWVVHGMLINKILSDQDRYAEAIVSRSVYPLRVTSISGALFVCFP